MRSLEIGSARLRYVMRGQGARGLLVPWCNFPWPDMPLLDALGETFTVLLASPRGYQESSRLPDTEEYSAEMLVGDLLAICDDAGLDEFGVLGYSLTAAMATWMARCSSRVTGVVAGGFPLLGSYERVLRRATGDAPGVPSYEFDVRAVLSFYRDLATLDDGALVSEIQCPLLAFWGADDGLLRSLSAVRDFGAALAVLGVDTMALAGLGHADAVLGLDAGALVAWLDRHT